MNLEQKIRLLIGDLLVNNIALQAKVEELTPKPDAQPLDTGDKEAAARLP
jgi:hypothetical protein